MTTFGTIEEILDFAIIREEEAAQFYTDLSDKVDKRWMRQLLMDFAREEQGHKNKLMAVKEGKQHLLSKAKVQDLKIADYLVNVTPGSDITYQEALTIAMKKEKAAFKLYNMLAASTDNKDLQSLFCALAQEEAKHKLRFEIEYDDLVYKEF
jgi:rubrerythrin